MFLISSSIENSQLDCVLMCTKAKKMWDKLNSIHEQKSATNKLMLMQKFHAYKMTASDSVQHVTRIQNMARQLTDVGEIVSDVVTL